MTLTWRDDRWHLDGHGIHAGSFVEMQWPDGTWQTVRVESADRGRWLNGHFDYHGESLYVRIDDGDYELRWPKG